MIAVQTKYFYVVSTIQTRDVIIVIACAISVQIIKNLFGLNRKTISLILVELTNFVTVR